MLARQFYHFQHATERINAVKVGVRSIAFNAGLASHLNNGEAESVHLVDDYLDILDKVPAVMKALAARSSVRVLPQV